MDETNTVNLEIQQPQPGLLVETPATFVSADPALTPAADRRLQAIARAAAAEYAGSPASQFMVETAATNAQAKLVVAQRLARYVDQCLATNSQN